VAATVRTVFIINPKHVIRAITYYLMSIGRNIDEFFGWYARSRRRTPMQSRLRPTETRAAQLWCRLRKARRT